MTFAMRMHPARAIDRDTRKGLILVFFAKTIQVCSFLSAIFDLLFSVAQYAQKNKK